MKSKTSAMSSGNKGEGFMLRNKTAISGIGTTSPSNKLEVNGTAGGLLVDVSQTNPTINTTSNNVTITSNGGSVIIQLG